MTVKPNFKVIIAGGRGFNDYEALKKHCNKILSEKVNDHNIIIISGNANGADKLGEKYANENGFELIIKPAKWDELGKMAGFVRNFEMANMADGLIAFWDGSSKGTKHMIKTAKEKHIPTRIINY